MWELGIEGKKGEGGDSVWEENMYEYVYGEKKIRLIAVKISETGHDMNGFVIEIK